MKEGAHGPLRVAQVMGNMNGAGVEAVVLNYYRHINRELVQFDFIICSNSAFIPYEEIESLGGRVFLVPPYRKFSRWIAALKELFRREGWQIVHSHMNALSVFPLYAAKKAGVSVRIAHSHSTAGKGEPVRNLLKYLLRPFSRRYPTHLCACGEYAAQWLFGKSRSSEVKLLPNAIQLNSFRFCSPIRAKLRDELGLGDKFVVGHVGRFMRQKNHTFLLDIFEEIRKHEPESILLLIGTGELEQKMRSRCRELRLEESVIFLGQRQDVAGLYQAMDVFLLPSLYEGFPVVAVEAQAAGLPCVFSDTITRQVQLTPSVEYLSLSDSAARWAEIACAKRFGERENVIFPELFDIQKTADNLTQYYMAMLT